VTALVAIVLTAAALTVILLPSVRRRASTHSLASRAALSEWHDRYRSALADLQDAELDWQVGNLSNEDYAQVRAEQRQRAAQALREATLRESILAQLAVEAVPDRGLADRADESRSLSNGVVAQRADTLNEGAATMTPTGEAPPGKATARARAATPIIAGGLAALGAVAGIALLYFRLTGAQAMQQPLAALPIDHAHAVIVDSAGFWVAHHGGLLRSNDGQAWRAAPVAGDLMALVSTGGRQLALGHDVLMASDDGGATWSPLAHDLPGTDVHGAQAGSGGLYAYVVGFGVFRTLDGGHWEQVGAQIAEDVGSLAVLPGTTGGDVLYLNAGGVVARSADGGRTWSGANGAGNLALAGFVNAVSVDARESLLYAGTSQGLFRSSSGGADWARLPFRGAVTAVGADGARIAAVDDRGQFYLSTDGGGTWTGGR